MRYVATAAALIITLVGFGSAREAWAGGLLQKLPDDGIWARFDQVTEQFSVKTGEPLGQPARGSLTLSSVGKTVVDGEACRFVEFSFSSKVRGPEGHEDDILNVWKLLIPESRVQAGQNPLDHVRRGWIKMPWPRQDVPPIVRQLNLANEPTYRHRLRLEVPDAPKDAATLNAEVIESKLGKFTCAAVVGTDTGPWPTAKGLMTQFEYETRLHPDAPFGVVRHRSVMKQSLANGKLVNQRVTTYTLAETGTNAGGEISEDLEPDRAFRLLNYAESLLADGKLDEVIAEFTSSLSDAPSFAVTYVGRGRALARKGDYKRAVADFRESIRRDPKLALAPNHLAWVLATCPDEAHRNGKEAIVLATRACELSAWKKSAYLATLATAHAEADEFETAVNWMTRAIDLATADELPDMEKKRDLFKSGKPFRDEKQK